MSQCTAKSKRTGERCQRPSMHGSTVCYHHGGKTPTGHALPQTRHGRYSRDLPTRLAARYEEATVDKELLALREDIALVDARLADLLSRVDSGESGQLWIEIKKAVHAFGRLRASKDYGKMDAAWYDIESIMEQAEQDYSAWAEIHSILEQRRKIVESERKRLVEMQQIVTTEQAMLFVSAVAESVRRHVSDSDARSAISDDLRRLVVSQGR